MFKVANNNEEIGKYLSNLIEQQYKSRRNFCRAYIQANDKEPDANSVNSMANRVSQILSGKKGIQLYDLPIFSELLGISCEQILSAGAYSVPISKRVTNYSIACSKDPCEWQQYIDREDRLILNSDEYNKTVLDYAIEFGNYDFIKFLMDNGYIWFDSGDKSSYCITFGADTSIECRKLQDRDQSLKNELYTKDELRVRIIAMAVDNKDVEMLNRLRAREDPVLDFAVRTNGYLARLPIPFAPTPDERNQNRIIRHIANSNEIILDYFTNTFEIQHQYGNHTTNSFMFPCISKLLDQLIVQNSPFAEEALRKALRHSQVAYDKLHQLALRIKNDAEYSREGWRERGQENFWREDIWIKPFQNDLNFNEEYNIVSFSRISTYTRSATSSSYTSDGLITNIARVTKTSRFSALRKLTEELNEFYEKLRNFADHLEEI